MFGMRPFLYEFLPISFINSGHHIMEVTTTELGALFFVNLKCVSNSKDYPSSSEILNLKGYCVNWPEDQNMT